MEHVVRKLPETSGGEKIESVKIGRVLYSRRLADRTRTLLKPPDSIPKPNPRKEGKMEETATATAAVEPSTEKATSYRYWVRESTGDAAPLPAPRKLDAADLAANPAPTTLGSVWNQVRFVPSSRLNHALGP
jgi:hypothetical protein